MRKTSKSLLFGFVLALVVHPSIHAQTTIGAPTAANTTPASQAPDEVMKKLSDLVHAGNYAEAQQTVAALLILYPDDQRLVKAKVLLDTAYVTAGAPSANPSTSNVASPQPASNLTGMDKVDYNALIELARQAQQTTDLEQQNASLKQFMTDSGLFLRKHPNEMVLWQLRVAAAISLNDPMAAYEAGQKLIASGAADSSDTNLQRLLAQLKNKGWLDKEQVEKQAKYYAPVGTWSLIINYDAETAQHEHKLSQSNGRWYGEGGGPATVEISRSDSDIRIDITTEDGVEHPYHLLRTKVANSGEIRWEGWTDLGWQPARSYELLDNNRTMRIVFSVVPTHKKSGNERFANTDLEYTYTFILHKN
jgi:hypothetical protein